MALYKVILAYDGTDFLGFQRQSEGRTVQASLEAALHEIGWEGSSIIAAGRTDTGVHASGQVISFEYPWNHSSEALRDALNANLPLDVAAISVEQVDGTFHPRYSAVSRCYSYRLLCSEVRQPLDERYAWRVWPPVSVDLLNDAAENLVGVHDFGAFGSPPKPGGSTMREIFSANWKVEQNQPIFELIGNAFLYHMVRRLVSFQVEIGQGKRNTEEINQLLDGEASEQVQGLAPPNGLVLKEVRYQD